MVSTKWPGAAALSVVRDVPISTGKLKAQSQLDTENAACEHRPPFYDDGKPVLTALCPVC